MRKNREKILIGIVAYGAVDPEVLEDYMRFAFHCGRRLPQYDFFLGVRSKSEQFRARNSIVESGRKLGVDYLLMLDDDMIVNPMVTSDKTDEYDLIEKLVKHKKDICGVLYFQRTGGCRPVLMTSVNDDAYRFLGDEEVDHKLQKVDVAGGGCLLINMKIFDKIKEPFFAPEFEYGTDIQLCRKAAAEGFEVWADTSIELGHVHNKKSIITSRNRHQFQMEDTTSGEFKKEMVSGDIYETLESDVFEYTGYENMESVTEIACAFLHNRGEHKISDAEWYRMYPRERVGRQLWYGNTPEKNQMTSFMLQSIVDNPPVRVLDFGSGIGIPAFNLATRGHDVTALDIKGTGTLEFLKWRAKKHNVPIKFIESEGGAPELNGHKFDVVVAMDSLEHIKDWKKALAVLAEHIEESGVMFSNNAILLDDGHPEHYSIDNREFVEECAKNSLLPLNQIAYVKKEKRDA